MLRFLCLALFLALTAEALVMSPLASARSAALAARGAEPTMGQVSLGRNQKSKLSKTQQKTVARRNDALITGTNWPPRTKPEPGKGYFFFQGPTPKTAVQKDMPDFFSAENFADVEVSPVQGTAAAAGFGSLALILLGLNSGGTTSMPAPPPKAAVEKKAAAPPAPKAEKPKVEKPKVEKPKAEPKAEKPKAEKKEIKEQVKNEVQEGLGDLLSSLNLDAK